MKNTMVLLSVMLIMTTSYAQDGRSFNGIAIGARYTHDFVLDGYVQVREWELEGDKLKLRDLGMHSYNAFRFEFSKKWKERNTVTVVYDQFFFRGDNVIAKDIAYNGTLINGRNGLDVSPTLYYRITAAYFRRLLDHEKFALDYAIGLVYDHLNFYVDGDVIEESPRNEVYENFGKQAFPYPFLGSKIGYKISNTDQVNLELSGTFIPRFKSFYREGGNIDLKYNTLQGDLSYTHDISAWRLAIGGTFRHMYLLQESAEDTNIFRILNAGPYFGLSYQF